jgi:ribose-phosphate pyrophosphokinase
LKREAEKIVEIRSFLMAKYVRIVSDVKIKSIPSLYPHQPLNYYHFTFFGEDRKRIWSKSICLIAPYLAYMRGTKLSIEGKCHLNVF